MDQLWWQTGVVYQIYPRSFQDSTGNGIGDLPGIISRLDYVGELGVDAIWISPFFTSPMRDFGYDVADYCDVDPLFGTLADAERLVEEAHSRGLKVLVDFVPNHCSSEHPWFVEAGSSRSSLRRDWFVWRDPAPGGGPPNNWLSVFGGPAWTLDERTGQYYRHSFLKDQPDLDWRNPAVVEALHEVLRFWMDRGVDGFRLDAILFGGKDPLEHVYDLGDPFVLEVFAGFRRVVDGYVAKSDFADQVAAVIPPQRVLIGEVHQYDLEEWAKYYGGVGAAGTPLGAAGLHMPFNFGLLKAPWTAGGVRAHVEAIERVTRDLGWPNYVLGNHDEARLTQRLGQDSDRLAAMLLLTLRGTPTLYYGDEIGMEQGDIPPEKQLDPWGLNVSAELGRDGCRTPMQWNSGPAAGFTTGTPWLPVHDDRAFRNVAVQLDEPDALLNLYRRLLELRRKHQALHRGSFRAVDSGSDDCFSFVREAPDAPGHFKRMFVALNFGDEDIHVVTPGPCRVLLWSHAPGEDLNLVEMVRLGPKEGAIAVVFG
ncbi:MAG: alpha-glucosidase [Rhodothermales bacterium]|jgi:alpha-glucosidase